MRWGMRRELEGLVLFIDFYELMKHGSTLILAVQSQYESQEVSLRVFLSSESPMKTTCL